MARVINLSFSAANPTLLLPISNGNSTNSITLSLPYPFVFQNLARKVTFTSTNNLSGAIINIVGTDQFGNTLQESLNGPNNDTVESFYQYNTLTRIGINQNYSNLSIGSGSTGTFQWVKLNSFSDLGVGTLSVEVVGTIEYSIFTTLDNIDYYKNTGSSYTYLFPKILSTPNNPITTSNGSNVVTVRVSSTVNLTTGDWVTIQNSSDINSITQDQLNITASITVLSSTIFSYETEGTANATESGGGNFVIIYSPSLPYAYAISGSEVDSSRNTLAPPIGSLQLKVISSSNSGALMGNILQQGID